MPTAINFYHLTQTPLDKALPRVLEKVLESGNRAVIRIRSEERMHVLNKSLWTYTTKFFLPHGIKEDGFCERQPVYLTTSDDDVPNGASVLALVEGYAVDGLEAYDKCLIMFDGLDPEQLATARSQWKALKQSDYEPVYWKQNEKGGWEKGAS